MRAGVPLAASLLTLALALAPLPYALNLVGAILAGHAIGIIFVVGHDACHQSFTPSTRLNRWIGRAVFIPALLPIPILPFKVFAACAGVMCVPRLRFFLVLAVARIPRYLALAYLGQQLGENSTAWLKAHIWHLLALAAAIGLALYALVKWVDARRPAAASGD